MRWALASAGAIGGLLAVGCLQADSTGTGLGSNQEGICTTCHHGSVGGVAGGGTTRNAGGSSGGGSSSGGGTSGGSTTVAAGFEQLRGRLGGGAFDAGPCSGVLLTSVVEDSASLITNSAQPIAGADVSAIAPTGVPIVGEATLTNASGQFGLCVTPGQAFTTEFQSTSYVTTYLEDCSLTGDTTVTAIPLGGTSTLAAYALVLPGYVQADPVILAQVASVSGASPCNDMTGWVISATLPDGGAFQYQTSYLSAMGLPTFKQTSTLPLPDGDGNGSVGIGLLYNIDPSAGDAVLVTASKPGGGGACPINGSGPFTGRVVIGPSTFSFAPLLVP